MKALRCGSQPLVTPPPTSERDGFREWGFHPPGSDSTHTVRGDPI